MFLYIKYKHEMINIPSPYPFTIKNELPVNWFFVELIIPFPGGELNDLIH